jgi:hypothetical protein
MTERQAIRASDHDRDAVIRLLGEQAGAGRLTFAELDERTDRALTVRTRAELAALVSDLPVTPSFDGQPGSDYPAPHRLPWCFACLLPLALGLLAGAGQFVAPLATPLAVLIGLAAAVICGLTWRRGTSR